MNLPKVVSVRNMRESDAAAIAGGIPSKELMLRAARGIFEALTFVGRVAIVAGPGNNGGDGYALACVLLENNITPVIFRAGGRFSEDGLYYYEKAIGMGCEEESLSAVTDLNGYDIIVDCLLGTGFMGEVRGDLREAIDKINSSGAFIVSADINSGLNGDTGLGENAVHSDLTVSIGSYKTGMFLGDAPGLIDKLRNADIGIEILRDEYYFLDSSMLYMFEGYNSLSLSFEDFYEKTGLSPDSAGFADALLELSRAESRPVVVKSGSSAAVGDLNYIYFCAEYAD